MGTEVPVRSQFNGTRWGWGMEKRFDFERLVELCQQTHEETRRSAARAVDRSLVVRNWLFGWYIVEFEQSGEDRAEYGAQTLKRLSAALKERIGRGFSLRSLEQFRRFYLQSEEILPQAGKTQTLSAISAAAQNPQTPCAKSTASGAGMSQALRSASATLIQRLPLGWSHYVTLLSVSDPEAADSTKSRPRRTAGASANSSASSTPPCTSGSRSAATSTRFAASPARDKWSKRRRTSSRTRWCWSSSAWSRHRRLVFYNRLLRCYVLIDLKTGKLTHQDLGQMQMYVNYFDRYVKIDGELPTVGILLCDHKK